MNNNNNNNNVLGHMNMEDLEVLLEIVESYIEVNEEVLEKEDLVRFNRVACLFSAVVNGVIDRDGNEIG